MKPSRGVLRAPDSFRKDFNFPYPDHQRSAMIEEYASNFFEANLVPAGWIYLDLWWSSYHSNARQLPKWRKKWLKENKRRYRSLTRWLRRELDPDTRYFTVCQDDRGVEFQRGVDVPENVFVFSAGGVGDLPIPLLCDLDLPSVKSAKRKTLVSFRGVIRHPVHSYPWRECLLNEFHGRKRSIIEDTTEAPVQVTDAWRRYVDLMRCSLFSLCPRGFGKTSYRLYEALHYGSIPVYIHDGDPWLPYAEEIDWESLAIVVSYKDVGGLYERLESYGAVALAEMQRNGAKLLESHFSMDGVMRYIVRKLNSMN